MTVSSLERRRLTLVKSLSSKSSVSDEVDQSILEEVFGEGIKSLYLMLFVEKFADIL